MQDVKEFPGLRPAVATAIGVPSLLFAGYIASLIIPVIVRAVMMTIVRIVTGA